MVSLGVSTLLLGWPMFAVAALLSWLVLRRVPPSLAPEPVAADEAAGREADAEAQLLRAVRRHGLRAGAVALVRAEHLLQRLLGARGRDEQQLVARLDRVVRASGR